MISYLKKSQKLKGVAVLRLDFNTEDDWRMRASLPTVKLLIKKGVKVLILSHKGRPKGFDGSLSLEKDALKLEKLLGKKVHFLRNFNFVKIKKLIDLAVPRSVFVLENLRFLPGEEKNSADLAIQLAKLGDFYVNDAFAVCHRKNASVVAITKHIKSYAGLLMEKEVAGLTRATQKPQKPLIIILGGTKLDDKINIVKNLERKTNYFLFGSSLLNEAKKTKFSHLIQGKKIIIPIDSISANGLYFDIGAETIDFYSQIIRSAKTIIWNGPVGKTEEKRYSNGSKAILLAIARTKCFKVIGGGETSNFVIKNNMQKKISLLSTGGGAMLDFLAGKPMPGLEALN